jgi:pyruvate dehydrogenase E2 component (dihydrolipoamide acetyltransferase)
MATPIILPQQGNSVESCLITSWKKKVGDTVSSGEVIAEVETDKALFTVESTADGVLLAQFYAVGDEAPVMTAIAAVGQAGEDVEDLRPAKAPTRQSEAPTPPTNGGSSAAKTPAIATPQPIATANGEVFISPRALRLAQQRGLNYAVLHGTGPEGRIIERDVQAALAGQPRLTRAAAAAQPTRTPTTGTGIGGRVTTHDLQNAPIETPTPPQTEVTATNLMDNVLEAIPVRGIRKVIAERMHASLRDMAQLTLNTSADARALLAYRKRLKATDDLNGISINDMLLYAVARTLPDFPALNATLEGDTITRYRSVNLGFAVDTSRGLMVPIIQAADQRTRCLVCHRKRPG